MYRNMLIVVLLSGFISPNAILTSAQEPENAAPDNETKVPPKILADSVTPTEAATVGNTVGKVVKEDISVTRSHHLPEGEKGGRQQIVHKLSEPVITVIIFGVMAGIVGIIVFIAYCVGRLRKKTSFDVQPPFLHDTGVPLSSVEIGNPVE